MNNSTAAELTLQEIVRADSIKLRSFQLELTDCAERLYCNEVIRIIPGKRLVAQGTWQGKEVVAKLFYERGKAKRHLDRDVSGIDELLQANVPTPPILYKGSATNKRIQVVIFEKITHAHSLEILWREQKESALFTKLMKKVIIELATQHVLGILQRDLHLKNFLVTQKKIYTLDGGAIEKFPDILDKNQSMDNLALFFAQLGVGTEHLQRMLFKIYAKSRGWIVKPADIDFLKTAVMAKNKERWLRYKKKIMRTCSSFIKIKKLNQSFIYDREYQSELFLNLLHNPEGFFSQPNMTVLKAGRSSTVIKVTVDGHELVVKRYNMKNVGHWLRRCLRTTRAVMCWRLSQKLRLFGMATAKPVAFVENHFLGLKGSSYFVMDYVAGQTLGEFFSSQGVKEGVDESQVAKIVVNTLNNLGKLKITHGDLKMSNILISGEQPVLIDLDGMREHATSFSLKRTFKKEMQRFMQNWQHQPKVYALFQRLFGV